MNCCETCSSYGVQTVAISINNQNTNVCFTCLEEWEKQNPDNRLCEICNKNISKINILKHNKRKYHNQLLENMHKRQYINKILNQKFEGNISSIVASYLFLLII